MFNFEFHSPWFLALFLLFIPLIIKHLKKRKQKGILIPSTQNIQTGNGYFWVNKILTLSKYFILSALIIALARPRTYTIKNNYEQGIDIVLAVDISLSMLARDFSPDRLTVLKKLSQDFVSQRENDRLGLVIYAAEAFMKVPLTTDHEVISTEIEEMQPGDVAHGTAIGEGLAVATKHLIKSKAKSKVIILMTDGMNTTRNAMPAEVASDLARNNGIKVYTIGIGTDGYAESPAVTPFGDIYFTPQKVEIDEHLLNSIAENTGGKYFRADSSESLEYIYKEINQLEKTKIKGKKNYEYTEFFRVFLWIGLGCLCLDAVLRWKFFRSIQ